MMMQMARNSDTLFPISELKREAIFNIPFFLPFASPWMEMLETHVT